MVVVELLIFMYVNKLLADTGDPPGLIYPAGYGSGENFPPIMGMGILAVSNFYDGYESGVAIPDGDLPIAILSHGTLTTSARSYHVGRQATKMGSNLCLCPLVNLLSIMLCM